MNRLDEFLTYKALAFKYAGNSDLLELALTNHENIPAIEKCTKNVCAHLALPLVDRLETTLQVLNMSKRQFIEAAIIDALDRFDSISKTHDIFEPHSVTNEAA